MTVSPSESAGIRVAVSFSLLLAVLGCRSPGGSVRPSWEKLEAERRSRIAFSMAQGDEQFENGAFSLALRHYLKALAMTTNNVFSGNITVAKAQAVLENVCASNSDIRRSAPRAMAANSFPSLVYVVPGS